MKTALLRKANESAELVVRVVEREAEAFERCVGMLATRLREGGRLWVLGNGGSHCDAQHVAVEFQHPIVEKRRPLFAMALGNDTALLTAIGNDSDFSQTLVQQLELVARSGDVVLGLSTSGASANVLRALRRARQMELATIGFAGRDGGPMLDVCDHCFVVPSWSIHRVQEVHTVLLHLLWDHVHVALGEDDVL